MRGTLALNSIGKNLKDLVNIIVKQDDGLLWNALPHYGIMYLFMTPFAIIGVISIILKRRENSSRIIMLFWLICAIVLGSLIMVNINRVNFIFLALIYFIAEGVVFVSDHIKYSIIAVTAALTISFVCFTGAYFGQQHTSTIEQYFFDSYGDAVSYVSKLDGPIYVSSKIGAGYMLTLFYSKTPPQEFIDTVVYPNPNTEFRPVSKFGKYIFGDPPTITKNIKYIIPKSDKGNFNQNQCKFIDFKYYTVVIGK